jgi:hypothetical protein
MKTRFLQVVIIANPAALSFMAGRFNSAAQRPMCQLANLFNPF